MPSFYCPSIDKDSKTAIISGDEYHHLKNVLRKSPGEEILLNSGKGLLATGTIESIGKREVSVVIQSVTAIQQSSPRLALAFTLLRQKNDEWLVEKATELGVAELYPLQTHNSVRHYSSNTVTRFQQAAIRAIKQCDNPWLPVIHAVQSLPDAIDTLMQTCYKLYVASERKPETSLADYVIDNDTCIFIGPEGGFTAEEFSLLQVKQIAEISLCPLILRAETAAIAAAAQVQLLRSYRNKGKISGTK